MNKSDQVARMLIIVAVIILIPLGMLEKRSIDAYLFGIMTGILMAVAILWGCKND